LFFYEQTIEAPFRNHEPCWEFLILNAKEVISLSEYGKFEGKYVPNDLNKDMMQEGYSEDKEDVCEGYEQNKDHECDAILCEDCLLGGENKSLFEAYMSQHYGHIKPTTKTTKENNMDINRNVLEIFKEDAVLAGKIANRFGDQYGTTDRDTIALERDKEDLLAIIKAEEDAEENK
jgi:hypothetical protein